MKPRDPDFPEEIPAIPEPRGESPLPEPAEPVLKPSDLVSHREEAAPHRTKASVPSTSSPSPPRQATDAEVWTELDEAEPNLFTSPSTDSPPGKPQRVEPGPTQGKPGSTNTKPREAEKPVGITTSDDDWGEEEVPYQPKELGVIDQLLLLLADGVMVWRKFVRWVRSLLPPDLQRQLSEEILTAMLLGLLILLLAAWNPLGRRAAEPVAGPQTLPRVGEVEIGSSIAEVEGEITAPSLPTSGNIVATPPPEPTPEQNLIAEIQAQVSRISRSYAAGLIQSVEVNLPENTLIVNVGENWYGLLQAQQDVVSQEIYERAQALEFDTLKLRDPDGVVVARNPVVGSTMVVLRRSHSADTGALGS